MTGLSDALICLVSRATAKSDALSFSAPAQPGRGDTCAIDWHNLLDLIARLSETCLMALDTDDIAPLPKPKQLDLENMSIEALTARIGELENEIAFIRALIEKKRASRDAASAFFKS